TSSSRRPRRAPATYARGAVRAARRSPPASRATASERAPTPRSRSSPPTPAPSPAPPPVTTSRTVPSRGADMAGGNSLFGPVNPALDAGYADPPPRKGFFTDTSVCIGCKACEVACKEWNLLPGGEEFDLLGMSYDNTGGLGANSWRHVAFIEQQRPA